MKKTLLILENDWELQRGNHTYVLNFKDKWEGDVIELTGLKTKSQEEIYKAVMQCSAIAVQTCFVNGSDSQFFDMLQMLSKIQNSKDIYIYLMGDDLEGYFINNLEDKEFYAIKQHKIWEMSDGREYEWSKPHRLLDFSEPVNRHAEVLRIAEEKRKFEEAYAKSAIERPTGQKVKIIACSTGGKLFSTLPFGEVVDVLDMSQTDPNPKRGLWVWGNGEAVKLINDCGLIEYEVMFEKMTPYDVLVEATQSTRINVEELSGLQIKGITSLIEERVESAHDIAQFICDDLGFERRGNRSRLINLIEKYNSQFEEKKEVAN